MHIKKLILLLFLVPVLAQAQKTTGPNYTYIAQRYEWLAGVFKALGIPAGDSAQFQTGQELRAGAIYYDSTGIDSGLYVWSGLAWRNYEPYTDADARAAISLTTTGTSGAATYSSATGVFNIPNYSGANTALSNLASVAINTSLISDADNTDDLGSSSIGWKDVYSRTLKLDGSTSGTTTLQASAIAGTTTVTLPALTGTVALLENSQSFTGAKTFTSNLFATGGFHTNSSAATSNFTAQPSGVANETNASWLYDGAASIQYRVGMRGSGNPVLPLNPYTAFQMSAMDVTESAGVTPYAGGMTLIPFNVINGAGSITNTATLRVTGPSTGQAPTGNASSIWVSSGNLRLGTEGTSIGTMTFEGNTSGVVTLTPAAAAGTPTLTFPTTSGTFALTSQLSIKTKNINLPLPSSAENEFTFFTPNAITITNTRVVLVGSASPSVTYNIAFGTDRTSLTNVYTAGQTVTSTTTGTDASGVNDNTIPANSWVILTTSAQSGTVTSLNASIAYTVD